jgi:hypothetical protein
MIQAGSVYWIKYQSSKHHLYFAITSARTPDDPVLLVNATTRKSTSDTTCILVPNLHPCVKKESVIEYGRSFVCQARALLNLLSQRPNLWRRVEDASPELLCRIQEGALRSPRLVEKHRRLLLSELGRGER